MQHLTVRGVSSLRSIGRRLGRPASTIKREIDRGIQEPGSQGHRSGYRRKQRFGAQQSGRTAKCVTPRCRRSGVPRCGHGARKPRSWPPTRGCVIWFRIG